MKFYGIFREGSQVNQVLCAVLVNLPVLAYGASIGWISPMTLLLQSEYSPKGVPLTDAEISLMASAPYLACIVFCLVISYIGDKVGRKISLLLLSMALATSWILLLCSFETWTLVFARALVGVTMAGCFVTCPIYTKEISDHTIRGALGCLVVLFRTTGNLFLYIIGDLLSYRTILWVCLSLPTFHMIVFVFMPDSPSFLVKKGRIEEAKKALGWLRCRTTSDMKVKEEIDLIYKEQNKDSGAKRFLLKSIFTDKILLKAFQIAMVATLAREVCGAIPVINFAGEIFTLASKDSGLVLTPNQQAMLLGVVQVVGSILASSVVERCGRKISLMASAPYLACIVFCLVISYIGDKVGRKISLLLLSMALATSWILLLCSFETWTLVFARALVGVTMAGCFVTCPIYTKEISDHTIRGALGCLVVLFRTTGNLFLYIIGDLLSYRTILWVCLSLPTFHMIVFVFMPDSPSFLVKKGRIEEAKKALGWLRCRTTSDMKVKEEIDLIYKEQNKDSGAKRFLLKSIFTDKILLKAFQIAMVATLAREVCGAIPVINFAGEIFTLASKDSGLVLTPNQQAMLLGVVQVVGSILASSVVERCGRKPLLCVTSLVSGLSMCLLGSWFLLRDYEIQAPSWLPLGTLCVCIFCDASGLQPIPIVITGEIFSFKYRGFVMGITMAVGSMADFLQLLFFKPLAKTVGIHVSFFFFGIVCLITAAYVVLVIPETKARSLEDIYRDLGNNKSTGEKEATENKEEITRF